MHRLTRLSGYLAVTGALLVTESYAQSNREFLELLDGTLDAWTIENTSEDNFRLDGDVLRVEQPQGWLRSTSEYADFRLDIEFRFLTDNADSGVFIRAVGNDTFARGWPNRSYQIQMRNPVLSSRFPPIGGLFRHGMPEGSISFDEEAVNRLNRPTGEWQRLEIEVVGEGAKAWFNGALVLEAGNIGNGRGGIGLQGETGALEFRSIRVREL